MTNHQQQATDMELAKHAEVEGQRLAEVKYTEDRDLANQLLGQAQMAQAISKISAVAGILKMKHVKEHKLYRSFSATAEKCTWAEYCKMLGEDYKNIDEQLVNLEALGADAFEAIQQMGLSRSALRKLRKLPEEDRQIIVESQAVELSDKEAVQELIEDIIAKKDKEKSFLEESNNQLKQSLEATNKVMSDKDARFNDVEKELHLREGRTLPWDKKIAPLKDEMNTISNVLDEVLGSMLAIHHAILNVDLDDDVRDIARRSLVMRHSEVLGRAATLVAECQGQFDLELGGYIGSAKDFIMQLPEDSMQQDAG